MRTPAALAGIISGPLSGPFVYGAIRCAQAGKWGMASLWASGAVAVWIALPWVAAKMWGIV